MKALVIVLLLMSGAATAVACDGLVIEHAWLRQPPPGSAVAAAYFEARNASPHELVIKAVSSADFSSVMLHTTRLIDGRMEMRPQGDIVLAPGAHFSAAPGGTHVMLSGARQALEPGVALHLELHCAAGAPLSVVLPVRRESPP